MVIEAKGKGDVELIQAPEGQFFCEGHLCHLPLSEQSQDARYCKFCQEIIEKEYRLMAERKGKPLSSVYKPVVRALSEADSPLAASPKDLPAELGKTKMSTLSGPASEVDIFRPRVRSKTYRKKELPEDLIHQMHNAGMGSKPIATRLRVEHQITVSYKTIQRLLAGKR